jgi:hypothetical protein
VGVDYAVLLVVATGIFRDVGQRRPLWWETPRALFGFDRNA